jgi:hypothetical protein
MGSRQPETLSVRRSHKAANCRWYGACSNSPDGSDADGFLDIFFTEGWTRGCRVAGGRHLTPGVIHDPSDMLPIGLLGILTLERFVWQVILGLCASARRFKRGPGHSLRCRQSQ